MQCESMICAITNKDVYHDNAECRTASGPPRRDMSTYQRSSHKCMSRVSISKQDDVIVLEELWVARSQYRLTWRTLVLT